MCSFFSIESALPLSGFIVLVSLLLGESSSTLGLVLLIMVTSLSLSLVTLFKRFYYHNPTRRVPLGSRTDESHLIACMHPHVNSARRGRLIVWAGPPHLVGPDPISRSPSLLGCPHGIVTSRMARIASNI